MTRYPTVPPAVVPANKAEVDRTDRQIRVARARQAVFERGVGLSLVVGMQESLDRLGELKDGLRWLLREEEVAAFRRWLERLEDDIMRGQRIEEREDVR
jgi:hypothetical protein